jgi:hypothetical protein
MKKLVIGLLMSLVAMSSQAQNCDFSGITFKVLQQRGNEYYFRTNMDEDACRYYLFTAYDYQLNKLDTLDNWSGTTGAVFNAKGKYQIRLNVFNECAGCDTVLTIEVDITVFGTLGYSQDIAAKNCKYYTFELTDRKDTCYNYYYNIYKADKWINSLTDKQWDELSDSALYFGYSWDENLVEYYSIKSERVKKFEFTDSGRYFVIPMVFNKCTQIDTWAMKKLNVCLEFKTISVKKVIQSPISVVGYYDMMGRQVDAIEPNKIYIIMYSNGQRRKVMQVQD